MVGAGPSAWSAAIFLARAGIKTLVIGDKESSGLFDASEVMNYAGFADPVSGSELLDRFETQAKKHGVEFVSGEVTHAARNEKMGTFTVRTADRTEYFATYLLLAHGANYIKAYLPGEREYAGKGVHYCALCDGPLYKGKRIAVLGNGNYAAEEAVQLAAYAEAVVIVSHSPAVHFSDAYGELLKKRGIEIIIGKAKEVTGAGETVAGLAFDGGRTIPADAIFVALGVASSSAFANQLGLEMNGNFIKAVDGNMRTSLPNVWVAGMARGGVNQIARSVGDGAVAAVDIIKSAKGLPNYIDHT